MYVCMYVCMYRYVCMYLFQEAQALPFVGKRLADKIMEIVSSGQLRRLEHVDREKERVISLFLNIHGVGQTTAHQFYTQV